MTLTIADLKQQNLILFEAISGSKAYGLDLPHSDTDIRGVFYLPQAHFYGLNYIPQVSNETNDEVYYELGRFVELLLQSNPSALELLFSPESCVLYRAPCFELPLRAFLSKQCKNSFAGYAMGQIKKARGLNKKIVNPLPKEKKSLLDFCYIIQEAKTVLLPDWLVEHRLNQRQLGLAALDHAKQLYAVYLDTTSQFGYQGVLRQPEDSMIVTSRIPKGEKAMAYLSFNQEGFQSYCRDYQSYWQWVEERNEERYRTNQAHGQDYDSKNLMHTFRLLETAKEIAELGELRVKRPNREALLAIRGGEFSYDDLLARAETFLQEVEQAFAQSNLPEQPDKEAALAALVTIRKVIYQ